MFGLFPTILIISSRFEVGHFIDLLYREKALSGALFPKTDKKTTAIYRRTLELGGIEKLERKVTRRYSAQPTSWTFESSSALVIERNESIRERGRAQWGSWWNAGDLAVRSFSSFSWPRGHNGRPAGRLSLWFPADACKAPREQYLFDGNSSLR